MSYFKNFQKVDYDIRGTGYTQKLTNLTHFTRIGTKFLDDVSFYSYYDIQDGERPDTISYNLYGTTEYYWTFFIINNSLKNSFNDWPKGTSQLKEFVEEKYQGLAAISDKKSTSEFYDIAGVLKVGETVRGTGGGADPNNPPKGIVKGNYPTLGYVHIEHIPGTPNFNPAGQGLLGLESQGAVYTSAIVKRAYAPRYHVDDSTGEQTLRRTAGTSPVTNYEWEYEQNIEKSKIRVIKPKYIVDVAREFAREMKNKSV